MNLGDESNQLQTNPLYAHRAAASEGDVLQNWASDKDASYDGYYLAQREGDASRRPFVFREDQILAEEDGVEIEGIVNKQGGVSGNYWLYVTAGFPPADLEKEDNHRCVVTADGSNVYQYFRGIQTIGGPLFLMFYFDGDVQFNENAHLSLTFENDQILNIYLPTITEDTFMHFLFLWVAEDGSTYWAEESQSPIYDGYEKEYMEAWYSLRWHESNLARGAYDGRFAEAGGTGHESEADSPAVDAGSKDWLNGGTTKTIIIDGNQQPDNVPPPLRGGYDNYDPSQDNAPAAWESSPVTHGAGDDLDIGYHYWGAGYDGNDNYTVVLDDIEKVVTLRHPKEALGKFYYPINNIEKEFYPEDEAAIASSNYNSVSRTLACFHTNQVFTGTLNMHTLVCSNRFRTGENSICVVDHLTSLTIGLRTGKPYVTHLTMIAGTGSSGTMSEPIYLAEGVQWDAFITAGGGWGAAQIKIYRYEPESEIEEERWILIGNRFEYTENINYRFQDVALAADGDELTILWIRDGYYWAELYGYRMTNASTRMTPDSQFETGGNWLKDIERDIPYGIQFESRVEGDWDPDINVDKMRITWTEWNTDEVLYQVHATRVGLNNGQLELGINYIISDDDIGSSKNPSIAVNRNLLSGISTDIKAFAGYTGPDAVRRNTLECINGVDNWLEPDTIDDRYGVYPWETWVTHRAFGTPRQIWIKSGEIQTENEIFEGLGYQYPSDIRICTNRQSDVDIDIYSAYNQAADTENQKLMIQQLEP